MSDFSACRRPIRLVLPLVALHWLLGAMLMTGPAKANESSYDPEVETLISLIHEPHELGWFMRTEIAMSRLVWPEGLKAQAAVAMAELLTDTDATIRQHAAWGLSRMERHWLESETVLAALLHATEDPDLGVREAAVSAIAMTSGQPEVERALLNALADSHWQVRWPAALGFTRRNYRESSAEALAHAIDDPDRRVALAAALAVQRHRPTADSILPILVRRFREGDAETRAVAAELLQFFWSKAHGGPVAIYVEMLADEERRIRQIGAEQLRNIFWLFDNNHLDGPVAGQVQSALPAAQLVLASYGEDDIAGIPQALQQIAVPTYRDRIAGFSFDPVEDSAPCISFDEHGRLGLGIPGDTRALQEMLGSPHAITATVTRRDQPWLGIEYLYHYPDVVVALSSPTWVIGMSTTSPAQVIGTDIRVGGSVDGALRRLGGDTSDIQWPTPFRAVNVDSCDDEYDERHMVLHFDEGLAITKIESGGFFRY